MQRTSQVHAGEEGHARPGWTTSRRGQDSPWKSVRMTEINGESTSMVWPTVGSRTTEEQNRFKQFMSLAKTWVELTSEDFMIATPMIPETDVCMRQSFLNDCRFDDHHAPTDNAPTVTPCVNKHFYVLGGTACTQSQCKDNKWRRRACCRRSVVNDVTRAWHRHAAVICRLVQLGTLCTNEMSVCKCNACNSLALYHSRLRVRIRSILFTV